MSAAWTVRELGPIEVAIESGARWHAARKLPHRHRESARPRQIRLFEIATDQHVERCRRAALAAVLAIDFASEGVFELAATLAESFRHAA